MKIYSVLALGVGMIFSAAAQDLNVLLEQHVVNGLVDYRVLKASPSLLTDYLNQAGKISKSEFNAWDEKQQFAFLINLYNASTLQLIVDHYPVKSIKRIRKGFKGPWDLPSVTLHGKRISLNELEHGIIRKHYPDPRAHMALVCAAKGCPILRSEAYTAERLDEQLDDQSRKYLATPAGLVINRKKGTASISAIFKWYGGDFSSVPDFVEKYSDESIKGLKIRYLSYDWSLNER